MQKVKVESILIGKIEDCILLKPDVEEYYNTPAVRGYAFHFSNGEGCAEAFKMCEILAKTCEDNVNGWDMYVGRVGGSDALIFFDEFSPECYTFTFNKCDMQTACDLADCYRDIVFGDESGEDEKTADTAKK